MVELWISLDFLGLSKYEISSNGRLYNVRTDCYLTGTKRKNGYTDVQLYHDDGARQHHTLSVLVATAFHGFGSPGMTVDHINRNRDDNRVCNLRWATYSEQNINRRKYTKQPKPVCQYDIKGNFIQIWEKAKDAAKALNISYDCIRKACKSHDSYRNCFWRYYVKNYPNEFWRLVPYENYSTLYASSYGRVMRENGEITEGYRNSYGYLKITFYEKNTGKRLEKHVHTLIAAAFYGITDDLVVNHKDRDKLNNRPDNLEYVTNQQNTIHAIQLGLSNPAKNGHPRKVMQVDSIGAIIKIYNSIKQASAETGIPSYQICGECRGRRQPRNNYKWLYYNQ